MKYSLIKDLLLFVILCTVQILVLSHIRLFGFATPLFYVYFILLFRRNYPRWGILLWSFAIGIVIDSFANTPGVAAASMTAVGMMQPMVLELFMQRESAENLKPSIRSMGFAYYLLYSLILILTYCILFFTLETFTFFNWLQWLESIGGCFFFTLILVLVLESVKHAKN